MSVAAVISMSFLPRRGGNACVRALSSEPLWVSKNCQRVDSDDGGMARVGRCVAGKEGIIDPGIG